MIVLPPTNHVGFVLLSIGINIGTCWFIIKCLYESDQDLDINRYRSAGAASLFAVSGWVTHLIHSIGVVGYTLETLFTVYLPSTLLSLGASVGSVLIFFFLLKRWVNSNTSVIFGSILITTSLIALYLSNLLMIYKHGSVYFDIFPGMVTLISCFCLSYIMLRFYTEERNKVKKFPSPIWMDGVTVGLFLSFIQFVGMTAVDIFVSVSHFQSIPFDVYGYSRVHSGTVAVMISIVLLGLFAAYFDNFKTMMEYKAEPELFTSLFYHTPNPLCMVDQTGRIVEANKPFLFKTGLHLDEPCNVKVLFKHTKKMSAYLERSFRGKITRYPAVILTKQGERSVFVTHIPMKKRSIITGIALVLHDYTELDQARKLLQEQVHMQKTIFSTISEGLFVHDVDGNVIEANEMAAKLLDVPYDKIKEVNPFHVQWHFTDENGETISNEQIPALKVLKFQKTYTNDILGIVKNGKTRWLSVNAAPLYIHQQLKGAVITFSDVTDDRQQALLIKKTNAELKIAMEKAEEANKVKSEFLSRISHELRTPLNSILGYSELILENYDRNKEVLPADVEKVKKIYQAGDHLHQMISDVLDLSRAELDRLDLKKEPVDIVEIIESAIDIILPYSERHHISIERKGAENKEMYVTGDQLYLRQVIVNLLTNAVKYNQPEGQVTIHLKKQDGRMVLTVEDNGIGIPTVHLSKIFEPFYRISFEHVSGAGIGLSMVKRVMEQMGGTYGVSSKIGEGSLFWISLPLKE